MNLPLKEPTSILTAVQKINAVLNEIIRLNNNGIAPVLIQQIYNYFDSRCYKRIQCGEDEDGNKIWDYEQVDQMPIENVIELEGVIRVLCREEWLHKHDKNKYSLFPKSDVIDCYIKNYEIEMQQAKDNDILRQINISNGTITKRLYYSNFAIAVATLVAALFYSSELIRQDWSDYQFSWSQFWIFSLGLILGGTILLILQMLLKRNKRQQAF